MEIHAYSEDYLPNARINLARMLDYGVNNLETDLDVFWDAFLKSEISNKFEKGDTSTIAGKSGIELAYEILNRKIDEIIPELPSERSPEYWLGWVLSFYQWHSNLSFKKITESISIKDMLNMYSPYHEMDVMSFVEELDEIILRKKIKTNLKKMREKANFSQSELSYLSGVPKRTIQQYEQRQKNINKAKFEYIVALTKALCCEPIDLYENLDK